MSVPHLSFDASKELETCTLLQVVAMNALQKVSIGVYDFELAASAEVQKQTMEARLIVR
jgi:hypothetical protein